MCALACELDVVTHTVDAWMFGFIDGWTDVCIDGMDD